MRIYGRRRSHSEDRAVYQADYAGAGCRDEMVGARQLADAQVPAFGEIREITMTVQLEFVAHACFRLWQDGKPFLVMDPFSPAELKIPDSGIKLETETVICSSLTDPAHSNMGVVKGNPHVINALDVA